MASRPDENEGVIIAKHALNLFAEDRYKAFDHTFDYGPEEISDTFSMMVAKGLWMMVYENTPLVDVIENNFRSSAVDTWKFLHADGRLRLSSRPAIGGIMCWGNESGGHAGIVLHTEDDDFTALALEVHGEGYRDLDIVTRNLADGPQRRYMKHVYLGTIIPPHYGNNHQRYLFEGTVTHR